MMNIPLYCLQQNIEHLNLRDSYSRLDWITPVDEPSDQPFLIVDDDKLGLADPGWPKIHPVYVDFLSGAMEHRRLHGGGVGQAVAKAVGMKKKKQLRILDATAGLGRDAFVLATLGATVLMLERNVVVNLLLANGLDRLKMDSGLIEISSRLNLAQATLLTHPELIQQFAPEVIYLDPMFPERSKSAKVKKDMALFHTIVGADEDADLLLEPALEFAEFRVVVKRSKHAPHLANREPTTALVGKSSRFDIYSKKAIC